MTVPKPPDERDSRDPRRDRFEEEWPELRKGLDRVLASRGVHSDRRDDLLQETGLRLYRRWEEIDRSAPVFKLAVTIALNLMRDEFRRGRHEVVCELPDKASSIDVERAGLARIEFDGVAEAMTKLSHDHRAVLLQDLSDEAVLAERSRDAVKMLRFRARRRLTTILQAASALLLWPWMKFNRSGGEQLSAASTTAALALVSALAIGGSDVSSATQQPRAVQVATPSAASSVSSEPRDRGTSRVVLARETTPGTSVASEDVGGGTDPVRVEAGGSSVEAKATVEADGIRVEVSDSGGPVPVCVAGGPEPNPLECPEEGDEADTP